MGRWTAQIIYMYIVTYRNLCGTFAGQIETTSS